MIPRTGLELLILLLVGTRQKIVPPLPWHEIPCTIAYHTIARKEGLVGVYFPYIFPFSRVSCPLISPINEQINVVVQQTAPTTYSTRGAYHGGNIVQSERGGLQKSPHAYHNAHLHGTPETLVVLVH